DVMLVIVNSAGLPAGSYSGTAFANTAFGTIGVQVNLTVGNVMSGLTAAPSSLTFSSLYGSGAAPQNVYITYNGSPVAITAATSTTTTGQSWLQVSISAAAGYVTVGVNVATLSPGASYTGTV